MEMNKNADYGNWVPAGILRMLWITIAVFAAITVILFVCPLSKIFGIIGFVITIIYLGMTLYMHCCRKIFAFDGGCIMGKIHQFLVDHFPWEESCKKAGILDGHGTILDIGCGAAALTNRIARTFPKTTVKGIDYWGAEWSYAKEQCENTRSLKVFPDMFGQKVVYGDMNQFVEELKSSGIVSEIHYIQNIERQSFVPNFVTAPWMIKNTGLIYGIK